MNKGVHDARPACSSPTASAAVNTPCVAATTRALYASYGARRTRSGGSSDTTIRDIGVLSAGGYADAAVQDSFCAGTSCVITVVYDQSGRGDHLTQASGGTVAPGRDKLLPGDVLGPQLDSGHRSASVIVDAPLDEDIDLAPKRAVAVVSLDVEPV